MMHVSCVKYRACVVHIFNYNSKGVDGDRCTAGACYILSLQFNRFQCVKILSRPGQHEVSGHTSVISNVSITNIWVDRHLGLTVMNVNVLDYKVGLLL